MLLLHLVPTCPDLCTLWLWWLSLAATYGGGVSPSDVGTNTPFTSAVVSRIATYACGVFSFHPLAQIPDLRTLGQLLMRGGGI